MYVDNNNREYYDQDRTPFSDFLIKLAKELGPDNDAIDYHGIMSALGDGRWHDRLGALPDLPKTPDRWVSGAPTTLFLTATFA